MQQPTREAARSALDRVAAADTMQKPMGGAGALRLRRPSSAFSPPPPPPCQGVGGKGEHRCPFGDKSKSMQMLYLLTICSGHGEKNAEKAYPRIYPSDGRRRSTGDGCGTPAGALRDAARVAPAECAAPLAPTAGTQGQDKTGVAADSRQTAKGGDRSSSAPGAIGAHAIRRSGRGRRRMSAVARCPPCPPAGAEMERGTLSSGPRRPIGFGGGKGG